MNKKFTYEYVENYFEEQNCELLETEYKNGKIPMQYKCNCGNISKISFSHFKQGQRCKKCSGLEKYTYKYVKNYFEEQDCILLEKYYKNTRTLMNYICSCGNISKIRFFDFKNGRRCKECGKEKSNQKQSFSYKYVKNYFEKQGCKLLEKKYKNTRTLMNYICSCGNISKIRFFDFKNGNRCKKCSNKRISKAMTGKGNHRYNPNLTTEERNDKRKYPGYYKWRKKIYKKYNYTCQCCGYQKKKQRKRSIQAHHIIGYNDDHSLRLEINNGIVLCSHCHQTFHGKYEKINNNQKQLTEFISNRKAK